jgi:hypothetical protein
MKDENKLITFVYTVFLGVVIALFVGLGINAFYQAPKFPEYPHIYGEKMTEQEEAAQKEYDASFEVYQGKERHYSRNVSIAALVSSVVLVAISLTLTKKVRAIADGVMLGGLLVLIYSVGRGAFSQNNIYSFVAATVAVAIVVSLGYFRFARTSKK